jgi:catechol 2,3-dioxygenase-like lactoylglutathione lyase family enzyme
MLREATAVPTIGVKDLQMAREFYEKRLGLEPLGKGDDHVQLYKCGNGSVEIYKSDFAGTNKATAMTFEVGDNIEEEVRNLRNKGVEFEHYEMSETNVEGDIHVMKDFKVAWFKDPDGNILCLHNH